MSIRFFILALSLSMTALLFPASGQINPPAQINPPPCTPSMITTFTPCVNFATNSTLNTTTPPASCCSSLQSLATTSKDCFCLIATGSVPFQIPINRSMAINLPRACNMPGVNLQCKAAGAPAPAPGSVTPGPSSSPNAAPSPQALTPPEAQAPGSTPESNASPTTPAADAPPTTPTNGGSNQPGSAGSTGSRAGVSPSAANPTYAVSPLLLLAGIGAIALKYY